LVGTPCDFVAVIYLVVHPALGALTLTIVLAAFLLASGVTRLIDAFRSEMPNRTWAVVDSILSIALGILLWAHWPFTGLWFIGFAVAVGLIFRGWAWVMIALALGSRAQRAAASPQPA
jgi:uncharacterized membrane protein HdeD (DUF308 family)